MAKACAQPRSGTATPSGATIVKATAKPLAGTATPSAALQKSISQHLATTETPTGALAKAIGKPLTGTSTPSGSFLKACGKALSGATSNTASFVKAVAKGLTGLIYVNNLLSALEVHYRYDSDLADTSGHGRDAVDGTESYVAGVVGSAVSGTPVATFTLGLNDFSVAFWGIWNPGNFGTRIDDVVISDGSGAIVTIRRKKASGTPSVTISVRGQSDVVYSNGVLASSGSNYIVLACENGTWTLYVGTTVAATGTGPGAFTLTSLSMAAAFVGAIDEFCLYSRALRSAEVTQLVHGPGPTGLGFDPTAGIEYSLRKAVAKASAGAITVSGTLAKACGIGLVASLALSVAFTKAVAKSLAGAVSLSAQFAVGLLITRSFSGTITPSGGAIVRAIGKALTGLINPSGAFTADPTINVPIDLEPSHPANVVRRPGILARVARRLDLVSRVIKRPWASRVIRRTLLMPSEFPTESRLKGVLESPTFLFDFTAFPEVAAGGVMSAPTAPAVSGLSFGTAVVTTADDENVLAGRGVWLRIAGGTVDTDYTVAVRATITDHNGNLSDREVRLIIQVR